MDLPEWLTREQVVLELLTGEGVGGPVLGPPITSRAYAEDARTLVRGPDGKQVSSSAFVVLPLDVAAAIPPGSRVTWRGEPRTALTVTRYDVAVQHWEVRLS